LGTEVELTHLRNEVTFEGSLSLGPDEGVVKTIFGDGAGRKHEENLRGRQAQPPPRPEGDPPRYQCRIDPH